VPEKSGFRLEGTIRHGKMVSEYCDYNIWGLIREDALLSENQRICQKSRQFYMFHSAGGKINIVICDNDLPVYGGYSGKSAEFALPCFIFHN